MPHQPEYAPQYSRAERLRLTLCFGLPALALMAVLDFWFFPWFQDFAGHASCRSLLGIPGTTVVFYGVFVLMPLLFCIIMTALLLPWVLDTLKSGQYPPPGQKTFHRTRIRRGLPAKLFGWVGIICLTAMYAAAANSGLYAASLLKNHQQKIQQQYPNGFPCHNGKAAFSGSLLFTNPA